ncbi:unnamed protein product [Penicillium camemberti]|uniref:Str. FM013 n=1 Tax=Penicillium camemberti (strain FM 013) TaxID=1429867 RepID=A0A0G4PS26_PENC3|nr:unnamed protein product [Penicillium camemberti]
MLQNCWAEGRDLLTNGGRYGPTSHRGWFTQPWSCIVSYSAGSR